MTTLFVTGGTGYVGSRFVSRLLERKSYREVYLLTRQAALPGDDSACNIVVGDVRDLSGYEEVLRHVDYVIWFAALRDHFAPWGKLYDFNVSPIRKVARILRSSKRLKCFIYISSISAIGNGEFSQSPINDFTPHAPVTPYGLSKLMAEEEIHNSQLPHLIVRLPFMYGSHYKRYSHIWFWKMLSGIPIHDRFCFRGRLSLLHIDDLASLLLRVIRSESIPMASSRIIVTDGQFHSVNAILAQIRAVFSNQSRHIQRESWDLSNLIRYSSKLFLPKELKYWSRIFYDRNYFAAERSESSPFLTHKYLTLTEGIVETFGRCRPDESE